MDVPSLHTELERCHAAAFAWALACCGYNRADAEDTLQQAYLKILDGSARFAGRSSLKTFLFGVIVQSARASRRRQRVRDALSGKVLIDAVGRLWAPPADAVAAEQRDAEAVRAALRGLSPRQREVLELVAYHGFTVDEAAGVLGVGVGSARTHYDRGKANLLALVSKAGGTR